METIIKNERPDYRNLAPRFTISAEGVHGFEPFDDRYESQQTPTQSSTGRPFNHGYASE
ncbi:MAG: hypothetical protein V1870_01200 [Candidatus Aenigmatarchaeota archaeon]